VKKSRRPVWEHQCRVGTSPYSQRGLSTPRYITLESKNAGNSTRIVVNGWPGRGAANWLAYTPDHVPPTAVDIASWTRGDAVARAKRLAVSKSRSDSKLTGRAKGRVISAHGWHKFRPEVRVGEIHLHVPKQSPLLITRVALPDSLIADERKAVLVFLVTCAAEIAAALESQLGIGGGRLDWRASKALQPVVLQLGLGFVPLKVIRRHRLRGTDVILRRTPERRT
jgi:hypothetical protein